MKEEFVTKKIIQDLVSNGFVIKAFDYPQSGTGVLLSPEHGNFPKLNLDIIALRDKDLWIFENKDRYYPKDFEKLDFLKKNLNEYEKSFKIKLDLDLNVLELRTFIGIPKEEKIKIKDNYKKLVDDVWGV
jgi:hypothetical protein